MVMWNRVSAATRHDFPEVTIDIDSIDAMTSRMVQRPQTLDTILTTGHHGDILDDLGIALVGGRGLVPSANLDPSRRSPSMFTPTHGPVFEVKPQASANPIGAFCAGALMLDYLGETGAAARLFEAIEQVTAAGAPLTQDLGGSATIREVTDAVVAAVRSGNT